MRARAEAVGIITSIIHDARGVYGDSNGKRERVPLCSTVLSPLGVKIMAARRFCHFRLRQRRAPRESRSRASDETDLARFFKATVETSTPGR